MSIPTNSNILYKKGIAEIIKCELNSKYDFEYTLIFEQVLDYNLRIKNGMLEKKRKQAAG